MGLTAYDMSDMGRLAQLAANPQSGASREEIYLAVASLYRIQGAGLNNRERELMREILRRLTRDVEMAIRIAHAQRLAEDASVPHDLILLLVDDSIEVARPLILHSPLLTEADSLKLIAQATGATTPASSANADNRQGAEAQLSTSQQDTAQMGGAMGGDPPPIPGKPADGLLDDGGLKALRDEIVRKAASGAYETRQ